MAEPRPGLASGHIPGARNVHFAKLLTAEGTLREPEQIRQIFEAAGVKFDRYARVMVVVVAAIRAKVNVC